MQRLELVARQSREEFAQSIQGYQRTVRADSERQMAGQLTRDWEEYLENHDRLIAISAMQAAGVNQMNLAMKQVDLVTQRNASAAEELSSTAEELSAQAEALQRLVGFFRVSSSEEPLPPPSWRSPGSAITAGPELPVYVALLLWGGLWLRNQRLRALLPLN
jgi:hypothetical protein